MIINIAYAHLFYDDYLITLTLDDENWIIISQLQAWFSRSEGGQR